MTNLPAPIAPNLVEKAAHPVSIQQAPPYITRQPLYIANPTLFTAKQWREVAREPVNKLCQRHILRELAALEWEITSDKPKEHEYIIKHYKRMFAGADDGDGWDVWLSRMLQDAMTLPIAGNSEVGVDEDTGMLGGLWHVDGSTLYPTYDRDVPFVQINPYNGLDRVYFLRGDLLRLRLHPRVDLVMKQYQEAPTESAWVGIESLSRVYIYYMKQLGDTPMVGILDVMDMTLEEAVDWAINFREMLEGIDPLKIPLLYDHTKPARFIPFTRSPQDLNILENFKRFAEMVASAYGLGIGDLRLFEHERVLAGVEASQRVTARSGVGFYAQAVEDMLNNSILFTDQSGIEFKFKLGMTGEEQQEAQLALTRAQIVSTLAGPSTPLLKPEDAQKQLQQWKVVDVELTGVPAAPGLEGLGGLLGGGEGALGGGGPEQPAPSAGEEETPSMAESLQKINAAADEMQQYKALAEQRLGGYVYKARSETLEQFQRLLQKAFQQAGRELDVEIVQGWMDALEAAGVLKATAAEELEAILAAQDWWLLPDITEQLFAILKQAYEEGSLGAIEGIQQAGYAAGLAASPTSPVTEFALRNPAVEELLREHAAKMVQHVDDGTKFFLRQNILAGVENGWGASEIARYIQGNLFGLDPREAEQLSESRILSIVNTELNWADSRATFDQFTAVGLKTKGWITSGHDQCELCLRNEAMGFVPLDYQYEGVFGEILHPPAHPRTCRCYLASNEADMKQFFADGAPYWLGGEADERLMDAVEEETQRMIDEGKAQQKSYSKEEIEKLKELVKDSDCVLSSEDFKRINDVFLRAEKTLPMNEWGQPDGYNLGKRSRFESEGDAQHWLMQFGLVPVISDSDLDVRGGNWAQAGVVWGKDGDGFVEAALVAAEDLPMEDINSGKAKVFGARGIRDSGIVAPPSLKARTDSAMVAIEVPPEIAAALGYTGNVLHITLAYLGRLDGRFDRKAAMDAVSSIVRQSTSFTVRLTGEMEQFGPDGDKVSAAVVELSPALKRVRDDLRAALVRYGQTADATWNEFRPHVTLGAGEAGDNKELAVTWHVKELVLFLGGDKSHWQFRDVWAEHVPTDFPPQDLSSRREKSETFTLWAENLPGQYRKEFADLVRARLDKEPAEATDEELLRVYHEWMETLVVGGFDYFKGTSGGEYPPLVRSVTKSAVGDWQIVGGSFGDEEFAALQAEGALGVARWAWRNGYAVVPKAFYKQEKDMDKTEFLEMMKAMQEGQAAVLRSMAEIMKSAPQPSPVMFNVQLPDKVDLTGSSFQIQQDAPPPVDMTPVAEAIKGLGEVVKAQPVDMTPVAEAIEKAMSAPPVASPHEIVVKAPGVVVQNEAPDMQPVADAIKGLGEQLSAQKPPVVEVNNEVLVPAQPVQLQVTMEQPETEVEIVKDIQGRPSKLIRRSKKK